MGVNTSPSEWGQHLHFKALGVLGMDKPYASAPKEGGRAQMVEAGRKREGRRQAEREGCPSTHCRAGSHVAGSLSESSAPGCRGNFVCTLGSPLTEKLGAAGGLWGLPGRKGQILGPGCYECVCTCVVCMCVCSVCGHVQCIRGMQWYVQWFVCCVCACMCMWGCAWCICCVCDMGIWYGMYVCM